MNKTLKIELSLWDMYDRTLHSLLMTILEPMHEGYTVTIDKIIRFIPIELKFNKKFEINEHWNKILVEVSFDIEEE